MGISNIIERLLPELGFDAQQCQKTPYFWELRQGSALIELYYHQKTGLIIGDARLCNLPPAQNSPLYQYLLVENNQLEGLTFSVQDQTVILSLLIQDRQFDVEMGRKLLLHLLEKADYYDNILVDRFGATWIEGLNPGN